jgi:excisionase family DNA binding protein
MDKLLLIGDVAKYLNVSTVTVYRLVETRKIAFYKIKGCLRFKQKDVDGFLDRSRVDLVEY